MVGKRNKEVVFG